MKNPVGYKIIFTTNETKEEIERIIDNFLREISSKERMDLVIDMTEEEIMKEYTLGVDVTSTEIDK